MIGEYQPDAVPDVPSMPDESPAMPEFPADPTGPDIGGEPQDSA
jgi:hypothetical protein